MTIDMNICRDNLCKLLDSSLTYVNGNNNEDLFPLFSEAIENNQNNYQAYISELNIIRNILKEDLEFFLNSDPAASSLEEIKLAYPGYKAIAIYRISHILYGLGYQVISRIFSEIGHGQTGIDIHPAAKIDCPFFIDHGTGIVIGETASIGKRVKLYQGITLGALSIPNANELRGVIRHPQVGNDVTIYANASILGPIHIGNNVTIGGNVFITEDVPDNTKVTIGKPELVYKSK